MATQVITSDKSVRQSLAFLQTLWADYHPRDFAVRLWDGSQWPAETGTPRFTLILRHPAALSRMFKNLTVILPWGRPMFLMTLTSRVILKQRSR